MIKKLLKFSILLYRRFTARSALPQLTSHKNSKLKAIGNALDETLNGVLTTEEKQRIRLIEDRRSFLLKSVEEINIIDFGAGSPTSNRSQDEMNNGVASKELVANICKASKPPFWTTFLFKLVRKLKPLSCVELGSCVGISASYQGSALEINGMGALQSLEGSPEIAKIAQQTVDNLNINNTSIVTGPFHKTLNDVLESAKPIDYFFNDAHHDHDAVIRYFNEAMPYLADEAIIIFDDISWSTGMRNAWNEIENDERVKLSIDFHVLGIALVNNDLNYKEKYRIPL